MNFAFATRRPRRYSSVLKVRGTVLEHIRMTANTRLCCGMAICMGGMSYRSSTRHILGMIDWDFGGSHVLPFADDYFELAHPDSDQDTDQRTKQGEEVYRSEFIIDRLIGPPPRVPRLRCLRRYKRLITHPKRHL
ncbi:hypothetical protein L210DRAFT_429234 [Boletus edulis BED1]|uniref:Uncharacterized protein n=1 Tax=Boletus edulis BED1 TaxID=1328754 RepID=A0AAD4BKX0_BOLED|nr:hypothetical protein L210DRAFT_429234 [Boletus edulis BED1]